MINSYVLLSALENFLHQREIEVTQLTAGPAVLLMLDWFRLAPLAAVAKSPGSDVLVYRYGGWSEGCATGFNFSLLRRIRERTADGAKTDWHAGITLMFEPSRYAALTPFSTVSADWQSLDAFLRAIESSPAFVALKDVTPMSAALESGGLR